MYNNVQLLPIYMIHTYISFELSFNIQTLPRHTHNQNQIFLYFKILFIFVVIMLCTFLSKRFRKKLFILCPLIGITETDSLYIDTYIYNKVDILSYHVHVYNDLTIYIMSYFLEFLMQHVQKSTFKIRFDIQYFCTPYFSRLYTFSLYYKKVPKFK